MSCLSAVCPGGPMLHESDERPASESSCQKYLGVVIIDRLQIVYIKINRHHKLVYLEDVWMALYLLHWKEIKVHCEIATDQDLLISLLRTLFFCTSDLELFDATLQLYQ